MRGPRITPIVKDLPALVPFVGPEAMQRKRGRAFAARLGANESLFGPSPKAVAVMQAAAGDNWKYADPENFQLREAIARFHSVKADNIVVGEGIDGLLGLAARIFAEPSSTVVTSHGGYPTFNFHVAGHGARLVKVPFRDDREDLPALLDAVIREDARIVYVSNPNNPMGSWWTGREITRLIDQLPDGVALLLDEAYCDTAPADAVPAIDVSNSQVVRLRTFSKAYGLAGARIGYAIGQADIISQFDKIRNHYGINRVGQAGALAALLDQDYLALAVRQIAQARDRISAIARQNAFSPLPSAANFVAIDCGRDGAFAQKVMEEVLARDCFIRKPGVPPLDRCIRVSCGPEEELDVFARVLPEAVKAARQE